MLSIVARACQSFKNGAREWRWSTQAQLTRRVFVETSMSSAGSDTSRHRAAISERKVSWHICIFGSSVGQSAGLVVCECMVPGSALGGILAFLLLCAGLTPFVIIIIILESVQAPLQPFHFQDTPPMTPHHTTLHQRSLD